MPNIYLCLYFLLSTEMYVVKWVQWWVWMCNIEVECKLYLLLQRCALTWLVWGRHKFKTVPEASRSSVKSYSWKKILNHAGAVTQCSEGRCTLLSARSALSHEWSIRVKYNGNTWFGEKAFLNIWKGPFSSPPSHLFSVVLNLQISLVISAVARQDSSPSSSVNRIVLGKCVTESFIFMNTDVFEERLQV